MRRILWCGPALGLVLGIACSVDEGAPGGENETERGAAGVDACPTAQVPRTPLRRLTRFEYANSVRDLLQVDPSAASELPADEVTNGFDNNAAVLTVSSLHAEKYVLVAEKLAAAAVADLPALTGCDAPSTGEEACARQFARSFGRRAFRRAVTDGDEQLLMTAYAVGRTGGSHEEGIEVMIRAALQSPSFLYRLETTSPGGAEASDGALVPLSQFEIATRLSYLIWASGPDDELLDAAERGELGGKEQIATRARQMLTSPKARVAVSNFVSQWTGARRLDITTKDAALFPEFTTEARAAMAAELSAFVDHVMWEGDHTLTSLLTAPIGFVNESLAPIYGVSVPLGGSGALQRVDLPPEQGRAGLLTQAGFLSVQGHPDQTSPVLRGKFVRSMLLCQPPPPPPPDADISPPDVGAGLTARDRAATHLDAGGGCYNCHQLMDPIGLAFESFDAIGRHRLTEGAQTIDVTGEVVNTTDAALAGEFHGVRELAEKLAQSSTVRDCVATQWFRFASGRLEAEREDACSLGTLQQAFDASGGDLQELVVAITQTDAFLHRPPIQP